MQQSSNKKCLTQYQFGSNTWKHTSTFKMSTLSRLFVRYWGKDHYLCWSSLFAANVGGTKSITRITLCTEGNSMADLKVVTQALVDH